LELTEPGSENRSKLLASLSEAQATGQRLSDSDLLGKVTGDCISSFELAQLAADILDDPRKSVVYGHLSECNTCCRVLADARECLHRDLTPAEACLADQIETPAVLHTRSRFSRPSLLRWSFAIPLAAAIILIAAVGLIVLRPARTRVAGLLADAYSQGRPFEYRLSLPGYGKRLAITRGAPSLVNNAALHRAEDEFAQLKPDAAHEAASLRLEGILRMLEKNPQEAVDALQKAASLDPGDTAIQVDLAAAIASRGDVQNGRSDYAQALELLSRIQQASPSNSAALFNLALVSQKMGLYQEAERFWHEFLSSSGATAAWKAEATTYLQEILEKKKPAHGV
jgi:tetratricopeptide (TPR) repeat protein